MSLKAPFPWFGKIPRNVAEKIGPQTPSGCFPWMAAKTNGYGVVQYKGRVCRAHRIVYEAAIGPIQDGYEIDHACRNRACVNPDHLEAVPQFVNNMRSMSASAIHARQSHCLRGHPFTEDSVYLRKRGHKIERFCRECSRIRDAARYKRRNSATEVELCQI